MQDAVAFEDVIRGEGMAIQQGMRRVDGS